MTEPPPAPSSERQTRHGRGALARDVAMLQFKLFLGGLHNLVLVPATLTAAAIDIVIGPGAQGGLFYRVLGWGQRADEAIGLYAALGRHPPSTSSTPKAEP